MQLAVEFPKQGALPIRHVTDRVEVLAHLMGFLVVAPAMLADGVGKNLSRLLEPARGAMLRFRLCQKVESNHQKRVD